jgi:hypothetical protein
MAIAKTLPFYERAAFKKIERIYGQAEPRRIRDAETSHSFALEEDALRKSRTFGAPLTEIVVSKAKKLWHEAGYTKAFEEELRKDLEPLYKELGAKYDLRYSYVLRPPTTDCSLVLSKYVGAVCLAFISSDNIVGGITFWTGALLLLNYSMDGLIFRSMDGMIYNLGHGLNNICCRPHSTEPTIE